MKDLAKIVSLLWKAFFQSDLWIYFGVSILLGFPFIDIFSFIFNLPSNTGSFNFGQVLLLCWIWFFLIVIVEIVNSKINNKVYFKIGNLYWGLLGFCITMFLMR
jgi:hypothetical protein